MDDGRRVTAAACTFISFYFDSARRLTTEERLFAIREVGKRLRRSPADSFITLENWIVRDEFLTIDLTSFVQRTEERMGHLAAAREMVASDPDILGGAPIVRGTRVPVHDIAASVATGLPMNRILSAYPSLDANKVELAVIYAKANPVRGRPKAGDALPGGSVVAAERCVHRRRKAE